MNEIAKSWLAGVAAIGMFAIMAVVASDVLMRYAFNRPSAWSNDVITLYLTPLIFYFTLPRSFSLNSQIRVDILQALLSVRTRLIAEVMSCAASAMFFVAIGVITADRAWEEYGSGDTIPGIIDWPDWLSTGFVPVGSMLLASRLLIACMGHITSLLGNAQIFPLPPIAGHGADPMLEAAAPDQAP